MPPRSWRCSGARADPDPPPREDPRPDGRRRRAAAVSPPCWLGTPGLAAAGRGLRNQLRPARPRPDPLRPGDARAALPGRRRWPPPATLGAPARPGARRRRHVSSPSITWPLVRWRARSRSSPRGQRDRSPLRIREHPVPARSPRRDAGSLRHPRPRPARRPSSPWASSTPPRPSRPSAQGLPYSCAPEFDDGRRSALEVEDVFHPLLVAPVPNSITLAGARNPDHRLQHVRQVHVPARPRRQAPSWPRRPHTAIARRYRARRLRVLSSMRSTDDIVEGKSAYWAEAERLLAIIRSLDPAEPALCLIDEILAGTNSAERRAASIEILQFVSHHGALLAATTHDVELTVALASALDCHHFERRGLRGRPQLRPSPAAVASRAAARPSRLLGDPGVPGRYRRRREAKGHRGGAGSRRRLSGLTPTVAKIRRSVTNDGGPAPAASARMWAIPRSNSPSDEKRELAGAVARQDGVVEDGGAAPPSAVIRAATSTRHVDRPADVIQPAMAAVVG